jgi:hypothetical protein
MSSDAATSGLPCGRAVVQADTTSQALLHTRVCEPDAPRTLVLESNFASAKPSGDGCGCRSACHAVHNQVTQGTCLSNAFLHPILF